MARCIELGKNGLGTTRPNPMVGCVIVSENKIIGEGFTSKYGDNHAEVNAINSVKDKLLLVKATLYVTLEPCSHVGKTPPCSDLILKHNIPNIVVGCIDDNVLVAGKGIERLKNAGCNVQVGILEDECKEHHKRFFTFHTKKRPYIILKWAQTQDNFIAPLTKKEKKPVWITGSLSRQLVHKWRAEEQAILVGTTTVLKDNPSLTVRNWTGESPIRVVLDRKLSIPKNATVFNGNVKTIVITDFNTENNHLTNEAIVYESIHFSENSVPQICDILFKHHITSIIIEGGSKTLQSFIDEGFWDEARVFTGITNFKTGVEAPKFLGKLLSEEKIETDTLRIYTNG